MKLVLINKPDLTIMSPGGNSYITVTGANAVQKVTVVDDPTMKVDNFNVCTQIVINCTYQAGQASVADVVTINGSSASSTINNKPMIVMGDNGSGSVVKASVVSCGQTSVSVD